MRSADALRDRVEKLRDSQSYRNYERVRQHVLRMKDLDAERAGTLAAPSAYWREELLNFEYVLDASPLVIDKLRQHTFHITGLRLYDYRSNKDTARQLMAEKLKALTKLGGAELLVPEAPDMGGFGFDINGALYNVDTLKFYEVLIALQQGAVLQELQGVQERRLVWEIGPGWGGFPYQLKKLCPNVTYVLMDFPELFLFSASYLMTMFPEARCAFYDGGSLDGLLQGWEELDFVFVSNTFLDDFKPARLDLAINMVSFQEMTSQQVEAYVSRAHELGAPYLYSLNRDKSPYNNELTSVSEIIGRHFWPHPIEVLPVSYTKMLDKAKKAKILKAKLAGKAGKPGHDYRHIVGWRRIET